MLLLLLPRQRGLPQRAADAPRRLGTLWPRSGGPTCCQGCRQRCGQHGDVLRLTGAPSLRPQGTPVSGSLTGLVAGSVTAGSRQEVASQDVQHIVCARTSQHSLRQERGVHRDLPSHREEGPDVSIAHRYEDTYQVRAYQQKDSMRLSEATFPGRTRRLSRRMCP